MTDWLSTLSTNSESSIINAGYTTNVAYQNAFLQTAEYQSACQNVSAAPDPLTYMMDAENAWMWKNHPLAAFFKVDIMGKPIFVTSKQALIGGGAATLLLFLILR